MWLTRRQCLASLGVAGLASLTTPVASSRAATSWRAPGTIALQGFDAVSYFVDEGRGPNPGQARFELGWRSRSWRFASAPNLDAFQRDPEVYAPRLGGFDPVGILEGRLVETDPQHFALLRGAGPDRLYLFRHALNRAGMLDRTSLFSEAEARWPLLRALTDADHQD